MNHTKTAVALLLAVSANFFRLARSLRLTHPPTGEQFYPTMTR